MRIIPAIDIIDGKCVRLTMGDYKAKTTYDYEPLEMAKVYEDHGLQYLHIVDLDGARSKRIVNHKVVEKICNQTNLKVDFGGGIKTKEDLQLAFDIGVQQVTIGSIAASQPYTFLEWLELFGSDKILLGADCKDRKIATQGWQNESSLDVIEFIADYQEKGVKYTICTDIAKDGMLRGPSIALYKEILELADVQLVASGGVSTKQDILDLQIIGCEGVIVGKAIYENKISLSELSQLC